MNKMKRLLEAEDVSTRMEALHHISNIYYGNAIPSIVMLESICKDLCLAAYKQ